MPPKRRSRRDNTRVSSEITLNDRDIAVFLLLIRYKYLDSYQLWRLLPPSLRQEKPNPNSKYSSLEIHFKQRLKRLTEWGYIRRALYHHERHRLEEGMIYTGFEIYEIWDAALLFLSHADIPHTSITGLSVGSAIQFPHARMIISTLASLEMGAVDAGVRMITWEEILARAPNETRHARDPWLFPEVSISYEFPEGPKRHNKKARPDCPPFGFEYTMPDGSKAANFFTIEAERTNKAWANNLEDTSWLQKALVYRELRRSGKLFSHFGLPKFYIIVVSPTRQHIETMKKLVMELTNGSGSEMFFILSDSPHYETA
jgi:hypothetical protein